MHETTICLLQHLKPSNEISTKSESLPAPTKQFGNLATASDFLACFFLENTQAKH